ncbi:hypothetical protein LN461_19145 [Xanthomonas arboricola]|uniref:hypothetical protein n=1 Tax=Xanthomonas arboricola TaxID=56448 RepID=UPI001E344FB4|nr:hypothetical protein [Xanthomonas arboricola]MCC8671453.1 hypothetical protein [Xanthomonas arboricola]
MSMYEGLTQCWVLSKNCTVNWSAWAVVVGLLGAIGGWVAAIVTFLAVIRPLKRRRDEDKAIAEAVMENFADDLIDFRHQMGMVSFSLSLVNARTNSARVEELVRGLGRKLKVPKVNPTPEFSELVRVINRLRRSVQNWNQTVSTFSLEMDPEYPSDFVEYAINDLHASHIKLMNAIRDAARQMQAILPNYKDGLTEIMVEHNGFIVMSE